MVFQKPVPFPMSIYDNIAYGIRHYEKLSRPDMDVRVEEALRQAALWEEAKDKLKQSALGELCFVAVSPDETSGRSAAHHRPELSGRR